MNQPLYLLTKALLSGFVIVAVSAFAKRNNTLASIIHSLPLMSLVAFVWLFAETRDTAPIGRHAFGTSWFVLPTLPLVLLLPALFKRGRHSRYHPALRAHDAAAQVRRHPTLTFHQSMIPRFTFCLLLVVLVGIVHAADPAKAAKVANTVFLDEIGVKNLRLQTVEAEEQIFEETLFALGRIEVLPGKRAVLSSRIAGRAVVVNARPDHAVKAGDPLVIVESRQPGEPPPQITLVAPMDGLVVELAVAPGDPVSPDKPLLAIVDLSTVYALARVPEHLADRLLRGQPVRVTSPGWPGEKWETQIEHLGALADPATGTLEVACHVNNEGTWLRPGMRAEFNVITRKRTDVMAVPREAVQGDGADRFLYVADDTIPNAFVKVPVVVGAMNGRLVEITQGLLPGDKVVTTGAYSLAFAGKGSVSLKEALDAAHGHEHNEDGSEVSKDQKAAGHTEGDGHDHGGAGGKLSSLTLFSLIGNGILLALLVVATLRRKPATHEAAAAPSTKRTSGGAEHAE